MDVEPWNFFSLSVDLPTKVDHRAQEVQAVEFNKGRDQPIDIMVLGVRDTYLGVCKLSEPMSIIVIKDHIFIVDLS